MISPVISAGLLYYLMNPSSISPLGHMLVIAQGVFCTRCCVLDTQQVVVQRAPAIRGGLEDALGNRVALERLGLLVEQCWAVVHRFCVYSIVLVQLTRATCKYSMYEF